MQHKKVGTIRSRRSGQPNLSKSDQQQSNIPKNDKQQKMDITKPENREIMKEPIDRYHGVYIVLLLHGIGVLIPWNMFITAEGYFRDFKLVGTHFSKDYLSYVGIAAQVPNLLSSLMNLFVPIRCRLTPRIMWSLVCMIAILILTEALAMVDSTDWPSVFFGITMAGVVALNFALGVYQNCVYGLTADFPIRYINAVSLGTNVNGTLVAVVHIITVAVSPDLRTSAMYYFLASIFVLVLCCVTYLALPYSEFFRFHHDRALAQRTAEEAVQKKEQYRVLSYLRVYISVIKQAWVQMFNIFFLFFITLSIFPALQVDVVAVDENFWIPPTYFPAVTCFLFFNFFAMVGNAVTNWILVPGPRYVWIPIVLRGLMLPYFMFCNYRPRTRVLPVYITNDYAYIFMGILMAFTSGYFCSLVMMYTPHVLSPDKARVAGMMAAFFLILGIVVGVNFTLVVATIIGHQNVTSIEDATNITTGMSITP